MVKWWEFLKMSLYFFILISAAWQDIRYRGIGKTFLLLAGFLGLVVSVGTGRQWWNVFISVIPGILLLGFSHLTDGGIGEGDGWFFVVSGLFWELKENLLLMSSGILFCSMYGLAWSAAVLARSGNIRRKTLPFLPYLLPVGLWLVLS